MSFLKLEKNINQFICKLNELIHLIQINLERNDKFINYLKTSECRENELKTFLSGSICDLKGLYEINFHQYSSVELLAGAYN